MKISPSKILIIVLLFIFYIGSEFTYNSEIIVNKRILVTGSFDIIHAGHIYYLQKASELGDVYVIVARNSTIRNIKHHNPIMSEEQRLYIIQSIKYVKYATLGNEGKDYMKKAIELVPDIILLGPTQTMTIESLRKKLNESRHPNIEVRKLNETYCETDLNSSTKIKNKIIKEK